MRRITYDDLINHFDGLASKNESMQELADMLYVVYDVEMTRSHNDESKSTFLECVNVLCTAIDLINQTDFNSSLYITVFCYAEVYAEKAMTELVEKHTGVKMSFAQSIRLIQGVREVIRKVKTETCDDSSKPA